MPCIIYYVLHIFYAISWWKLTGEKSIMALAGCNSSTSIIHTLILILDYLLRLSAYPGFVNWEPAINSGIYKLRVVMRYPRNFDFPSDRFF